MTTRIITGDCRDVLPTMPAASFDCVVTSPPYWGLRDYGVDGQIGLEPTLDAYVETMRDVARGLWRVLKPEGTFWLNIGDSYSSTTKGTGGSGESSGLMLDGRSDAGRASKIAAVARQQHAPIKVSSGLKPKDLCGVPWRVAFALQADGWWLRSAIVWHKPSPMPESVRDRPTSAYEMVFLLTNGATYFYDAEAIAEKAEQSSGGFQSRARSGLPTIQRADAFVPDRLDAGYCRGKGAIGETRNARNVWTIASQPFSGSHFATMPPDLAERCIKAGCPKGGHVLDPFGGAGTTALVADRLGRDATLIELNPAYRDMGADRVTADAPLFAEVTA